ncbi:GTPase domain-containing protein [Metabacillus sp. YM-086]|uniref:GTPase domain-containing protein n=1 Tax=Metabacillus sp. YM-086 TaxID=3341729 RepID=UPI003A890517
MTREDQLIEKSFYETFLSDGDNRRPSRILGQAYFEEQNREESFDLSYIRFAQGEIYFHDLDYEAAIFKWENIKNELEPWAKMNIGDAYSQLGLLSAAEDMYNSIETSEDTLKSEVALKLFFLYKERGKMEHAYETIKKAVLLDPDYPNVTRVARDFYEENEDDENAVKLAVDELIRTEKEEWFSVITSYVKAGNTKSFLPDFFADALLTIHDVNKQSFISFTHALWNSYRNEESYLQWINTINELFMIVQHEEEFEWNQIVQLYEETFIELTDGRYFLQDLQVVMPNLLSCWLKLSTRENGLTPAATVLAWNEIFSGHIIHDSIYRAEAIIFEVENNQSGLQQALQLFKTVKKWAEGHSLAVDYKTVWWLEELLNSNIKQHFLLAGFEGSGKTTFMHSLLGEKPYKGTTASMVIFHDDDELSFSQITSTGHRFLENQREMLEHMEETSLFQVKQPCIFLHENQCAIIDTPSLNGSFRNEFFDTLLLADGVFFVLDGADPLSDEEYNVLCQMKKFAPDINVHFILNKVDLIASDVNTQATINDIKRKVVNIYPEADILPYSSLHPFSQQSSKLNTFVNTHYPFDMKEKPNKRTANVLTLIRHVLTDLLHKREEMEKGFIYSIQWNEDILGRLKGLSLKLKDLQHEKVETIIAAYRTLLKESKTELMETIPRLLKESSEYIKEDSDFKEIHLNLNEKMNEKIQSYIEETLLPTVYHQLDTWVSASHDEFLESQSFLVEMSETFNDIYQEKKLSLQCDFALLDDWRRDLDRMTGRIQYEKENIMLKKKPAQLLLKGAGRLLGTMNQSNNMLYNQYKKYVENETYEEVTASIANKLFLPFELFEKGLSQDVTSFFQGAIQEVKETIAETETIIQDGKESLDNMRTNPEVFYDPLKLFEVNLLQQEFSLQAKKDYSRTG